MRKLLMYVAVYAPMGWAGAPVFDAHVHLRDGESSLLQYEAEARAAGLELTGAAVMWFGGPQQALAGDPAAARGVRVLKLHAHTQHFEVSDPRVLSLVTRAGELGMVVLLDNGGILPGDSQNLFNLAVRAPKTRFIFAHLGGLDFRFWNILAIARTADGFALENVYFDISATVLLAADSPLEDEFVWTLRNVGTDRVMLGSDYPQITLAQAVHALDRLDLTAAEKQEIRGGNARRLFKAE